MFTQCLSGVVIKDCFHYLINVALDSSQNSTFAILNCLLMEISLLTANWHLAISNWHLAISNWQLACRVKISIVCQSRNTMMGTSLTLVRSISSRTNTAQGRVPKSQIDRPILTLESKLCQLLHMGLLRLNLRVNHNLFQAAALSINCH